MPLVEIFDTDPYLVILAYEGWTPEEFEKVVPNHILIRNLGDWHYETWVHPKHGQVEAWVLDKEPVDA